MVSLTVLNIFHSTHGILNSADPSIALKILNSTEHLP